MLSQPLAVQNLVPVTVLPTSPSDGQEVLYQPPSDATLGQPVLWHLRYRAAIADAYRWEAVGSVLPLLAEVVAQTALVAPLTTYQTLDGPSITVPLAGYYDLEIGGYGYSSNASTVSTNVYMTAKLGAAAASDNESILVGAQGYLAWNAARRLRRGPLAAGSAVAGAYKGSNTTGGVSVGGRWIAAYPARVG